MQNIPNITNTQKNKDKTPKQPKQKSLRKCHHYCSLQEEHGRAQLEMNSSWPCLNTNRLVTISQSSLMHSLRKKSSSRGWVVISSTRSRHSNNSSVQREMHWRKTHNQNYRKTYCSYFSHSTQQGQYQTYVLSYR